MAASAFASVNITLLGARGIYWNITFALVMTLFNLAFIKCDQWTETGNKINSFKPSTWMILVKTVKTSVFLFNYSTLEHVIYFYSRYVKNLYNHHVQHSALSLVYPCIKGSTKRLKINSTPRIYQEIKEKNLSTFCLHSLKPLAKSQGEMAVDKTRIGPDRIGSDRIGSDWQNLDRVGRTHKTWIGSNSIKQTHIYPLKVGAFQIPIKNGQVVSLDQDDEERSRKWLSLHCFCFFLLHMKTVSVSGTHNSLHWNLTWLTKNTLLFVHLAFNWNLHNESCIAVCLEFSSGIHSCSTPVMSSMLKYALSNS